MGDAGGGSGSMHVLMLPWLAFGHILPFTELAKRIARQGHRVTLLSTPRNTRRLIRIPPDLAGLVHVVDVHLPRVERLPEGAEASIDLPSDDLRPYLRVAYDTAFAGKLSGILREPPGPERPDWVLFDYAAYWAPAAAARHGVPCAFLSLFGAATLGFYGPPEALMGRGEHARTKLEDLTVVPGYVPFPTTVAYRRFEAREIFEPGLVPDDSGVSEGYRFGVSIRESQLVGIRSSAEVEPEWLRVLGEIYQKQVIPVGLFPPPPTQDVAGHEGTLQWLDRQAPCSVVYAAFGSEAKLTSAQLQTIALGLEDSGLPFLWAFRPPADAETGEATAGLPEGFEERVNGRGIVCRGWVPQARFLAHGSVGVFLTHAGWNSITEGLARGVKLVLLPLVFDQGLNSRLLVEKKIGVEVERDEDDGSFAPKDIAAALRSVMVEDEGEEFGTKVKELSEVFGNEEVNDQCVRDFLRRLSEYSTASSNRDSSVSGL
ncbi:putative UDP-rhamnose:rhamnosyltransferase 1 [Panicum miliaceum]|uniref:UDP-rhamnose:rhamnosyltransferase 1 n=1 Tax=Panicum miliaceum TaxID=4540 RepID=A0A3L6SKE7_PANMI|nr:putative UDP-rhamnose:rhamnosyltransferase 1 [Panicum miliaceum]